MKLIVKNNKKCHWNQCLCLSCFIFYSFFYHSQFLVNSAIAPFSVQARLSTNKHSAVAFGYFCFQRCTVRILGDCTGVHLSPFCPTVWSVRRQRHMLDHKFCLKKHSSPDRLDEPNNPHLSTTYQHNTLAVFTVAPQCPIGLFLNVSLCVCQHKADKEKKACGRASLVR